MVRFPIYSVDVGYMLNRETGYIKIGHFADKTYDEYLKAFADLKEKGMQNLILDLRGNRRIFENGHPDCR